MDNGVVTLLPGYNPNACISAGQRGAVNYKTGDIGDDNRGDSSMD